MHMCVSSHLSLSLRAAQCGDMFLILRKFACSRDFSGSPMVKTPSFQCRRHRFDPWSGN